MVNFVQSMLVGSSVEVFIAEYSVAPGTQLSPPIVAAIKACDLFLLIWSKDAQASDWVPQEIGIAKAENRNILPVVLQQGLKLPGFIADLKYLDVPKNPEAAFAWLRDHVFARATAKQQQDSVALLALGAAVLWLMSRG